MKNKTVKKMSVAMAILGLIWSCGKDDAPTPAVPKNSAPTISDQSFTVSEDITDEKTIGTVKATDADGDKLAFSIIANDNNMFEVSDTGALSLASGKALDYETAAEHVIKVSVSDGTDQKEANITIDVTNAVETLAEDPSSFVTLWNIPENDFEIIIGTNSDYEYDYTIDWGDGTVEELTMQNPHHVYSSVGEYKVAIQGVFPAIKMGHSDLITEEGIEVLKSLIGLEQWGTNIWESFNGGFANCINMEYHATDIPNLQNVEDMSQMFASLSYGELEDFGAPSVFNADLSGWDVTNVTNMNGMFARAELFTSDLSGWNVSNVTDFGGMFLQAKSFNSDLSGWGMGNATNISALFYGASSFNADLSGWDVSNVTDMSALFYSASLFDSDISGWDISKVTDTASMFYNADAFNIDIGGWDVSNVTDMSYMFGNTELFNKNIGGWDVSKVTNMNSMFGRAESFNVDIGSWDVGNVTNMAAMFSEARLFNADIGSWDVSSVTDMTAMFADADSFNADISGWEVSNVTNMLAMFANADLFNVDIGNWDVGNVLYMGVMFAEALSFDQNLANWDITSVTNMSSMLPNCGMSKENYAATLVGWANSENVPTNITLGAENIQYCADSEAATARETLINDFGWTFSGDSPVNCN